MTNICAEMRLYVVNKYFKHKSLYMYTRLASGQEGNEPDKSGAGEERYTAYVQDVSALRGIG